MAMMRVSYYDRPPLPSLFDDRIGTDEDQKRVVGTLTDDHAVCSYGMPTVVTADGRTLGPADLPAGDATIFVGGIPEAEYDAALVDAARRAGYRTDV